MQNVMACENQQNIAAGMELNILRQRQYGRVFFPDGIFKRISVMEFAAFRFRFR